MNATSQVPSAAERASPEDARAIMRHWLKHRTPISYAYSRAGGELLETGTGVLGGMDAEYLELRTSSTTLIAAIRGAEFSIGPQRFFGPQFLTSRLVEGVSLQLPSGDWFFLCHRQEQELFVHGHSLQRT